MAPGEAMLRETRSTRWYHLPGPTFALVILLLLDYGLESWRHGWPAIPGLTDGFGRVGTELQNLFGDAGPRYFAYFFGLLTLLAALWLLVRYLRWRRTAYAVTTDRVILQRGVVTVDFDEVPVSKVRAVDVHQTGFERILRYGTIKISSEGDNPIANEAWHGIPHPWEFSKLVDAAAQRYTRQR